jgi:hypothetical protein
VGIIDITSVLNSWYNSKAGIQDGSTNSTSDTSTAGAALSVLGGSSASSSSSSSSPTSPSAPTNPAPPWSNSAAPPTSALVQSVLNGGKFIDPSAAKLSVAGGSATTNQNYKDLFALYQGLSALNGIATNAAAANVGPTQLAQLNKAFQTGLQQVQSFLSSNPFDGFQVFQGTTFTADKTTSAVAKETDIYTGATLFTGAANIPIPAFQGDVKFNLSVAKTSGTQIDVTFDLSEMGPTPRTMANVLGYLNSKLQAAGVQTRFSEQVTPGAPQTVTAGGKTVKLPDSQPQFALKVQGNTVERLTFSAPTSDPAVYVGQSSGITSSSVKGVTPDAVQQFTKFDASSTPVAGDSTSGVVRRQTLGANISSVQDTVTSADGSIYMLANINGTTGGQAIQGTQDVALIKCDSAGNVVYTRTLGAANSASGLSLALSPDGTQIGIAGTVTGNLNPGPTAGASTAAASTANPIPQGFVTVFDSQGNEQWTQQIAATGGTGSGVQANAVAFGAGGMVYVAGQTDGKLTGGTSSGSIDAFVQAFHAKSVPLNDGSGQSQWVVTPSYVNQFGTGGVDRATGLAVSGTGVYVSSVENGDAVVRQFTPSGNNSASLTPTATRDLGSLKGGGVAGVAINADGSIVIAGSTNNGALDAGTVTQPYAAGEEAFVASLSPDLQPSASDTLTYVGSARDQTATAFTVSGGQVYLTGKIATDPIPGEGQTTASNGYAAAVDPQTGQVTWSQTFVGLDHQAAPTSIAVGQNGASVLDQLGLPSGKIDFSASQQLVANTSVRPGDKFFVKVGPNGALTPVTISAGDTYQSLATKIQRASGFNLKATVLPGAGGSQLSIAQAASGQPVQILAGPDGLDALGSLGLTAGVVSKTASKATALARVQTQGSLPPTTSLKNGYSLQLPSTLTLNTPADIKQAMATLANAINVVQGVYKNMITPPPSAAAHTSGTVPKYLSDQLANYQSGLARLSGSS